ncbi:MAG: PTS glucose transporter subunit IIA [Acetatifactor sp.]|nr:PTS glucose transporter subunit IIA [Acetatifactor sp.]MDE7353263.1 PTS glucose transporter subunit IIA [Acetatifactor sp.]
MMWYFFVLTAVTGAAMTAGFCMGRITGRKGDPEEEMDEDAAPADRKPAKERRVERPGSCGYVGSPVSGQVRALKEGECPSIVIDPKEDRLYAPANGKITRLFPMGNAFLFHTEFGTELFIQAGDARDDLLGRYFRPRVLQNEIVGKGKLLLEFDRQGLEAEGISPEVSVRLENRSYDSDILSDSGENVRIGEDIIQIRMEEV